MSINELVPYLQSPHLHERLYAKQVLFHMDNKVLANNISTLVALLEESDALSRRAALDLLSKLSPVSLLTALLGRIIPHLDDDDADVRRGCLAVLARVPSEALNEHAEVLLSFITHESWPVRVTGLGAFACLSASLIQTHLEDVLLISLNDVDSISVRWAALDLLQKKVQQFLGGGEGGGEDEVEGGVEVGKFILNTEKARSSSRCSSRSSSRNGSTTIDSHLEESERESVEEVVMGQATKVVDCFGDSDMFVRWKAVTVLRSYTALAVTPELLEALLEALEHPLPAARAAALLALSRLQEGRVVGGKWRKGGEEGDGEEGEEEEEVEEVEEEERLPLLHQRPRVVHEVCKRVQDEDLAVRWAALHALKALPADALVGAARAEVEEGQGDGWLVSEIARGLRILKGKTSVADAGVDGEMHAYVQQATGRLLEKLHEISGGSLVGEEVLAEVRQMRKRQEEERAGRQGSWDDDTYRPD